MIVKMKKAQLYALKENREALLSALQRTGEFMIIDDGEGAGPGSEESGDVNLQQSEALLKFLSRYKEKQSILAPRPWVSYDAFLADNPDGEALKAQLADLSESLNRLQGEINALESQNEQLTPWLALDIPVEALKGTKDAAFHTGFLPAGLRDEAQAAVDEAGADLSILGSTSDGLSVLISVYRGDEDTLMDGLKAQGFTEAAPPGVTGTPQKVYEANDARKAKCLEEIAGVEKAVATLAPEQEKLQLLSEQYDARMERRQVHTRETISTIYLAGWVREDRMDRIIQAVESVTADYSLEFIDPAEDEVPPTVTKNNRFLSQFETITDMFSKPKQGSIDPAPIAGPWYWIIFGMMMGDVGYGICMLILFYAFIKIKKPRGDSARLIYVLFYSSIPTIIFGVLFGSYFGETWNPILFAPLDQPITMLIFTLVIGILHIFSGMGIKAAELIRDGHFWDAVFDEFSWMILLTGLGFLFLDPLKTAGMVMAIGGAAVVLLTAGRDKPTIIGKLTGGLLGLYGISGYFSDILSYSRILALSLATGVIGMVMNLLARMVGGSFIGFIFALLIYLAGHVFNLAMSLLSAFVHDSRLQYIEFFNKFYEGGGKPFKPLSVKSKHIDVIDEDDKATNF